MKRLKLVFALMILAVMSAMSYMLYSNIDLLAENESQTAIVKQEADYSLTEPHFIKMDGDRLVLEVKAVEASYYNKDNSADLRYPRVEYVGKDDKKSIILGNRGKVYTDENRVVLEGNVRLYTGDGYLLETPLVEYSGNEKKAYTEKKVRLRGKGFDIQGVGFSAHIENEKFQINKQVEALFDKSLEEQFPD